jgi:hypothetical protein
MKICNELVQDLMCEDEKIIVQYLIRYINHNELSCDQEIMVKKILSQINDAKLSSCSIDGKIVME